LPARQPVIGWYAAIEDILDTLPESAFAPWQLTRLKTHPVYGDFLVSGTDALVREAHEPCVTLTGSLDTHTASPRAFLVHPTQMDSFPIRGDRGPSQTITSTHGIPRAFLVSTQSQGTPDGEPAGVSVRDGAQPSVTIARNADRMRAFLVDCTTQKATDNQGARGLTVRDETDPAFTITAGTDRRPIRAGVAGRVVSLTPRALARFQSMPDSYILPERRKDALRIIGNGVACKVAQLLVEQFMEAGL
jgi:site-specific DNA-cytosine methylase